MNIQDFSDNFTTLLASYQHVAPFGEASSRQDITLDEYEKSVFLTLAQEEEVISLYTGRNAQGEGFEETEELRRYLSSLICEANLAPITNTSEKPIGLDGEKNTRFFTLPDGSEENKPAVWFITYESIKLDGDDRPCAGISTLQVVPVRQDEYHRLRKNPFRGVNKRRALRLDLPDNMVEIVSKFTISSYYIRYITKPEPIILTELADEQQIEGHTAPNPCKLHEALHQRILERAVHLALRSKGITSQQVREASKT